MFRIALATFSRTSFDASLISRSSTNRTVIDARPSAMRDWISSMPETPLIASSIGSMTEVDISSGLAPGSASGDADRGRVGLGKQIDTEVAERTLPNTTSDMTSIVAKTGRRTQRSDSTRELPKTLEPLSRIVAQPFRAARSRANQPPPRLRRSAGAASREGGSPALRMAMGAGHPKSIDAYFLEVELDQHDRLFADNPAVMPRFDGDNLRQPCVRRRSRRRIRCGFRR